MLFYKCFDWFKKLRLFVNERNLKIDVVLKALHAVVIGCFSLNEAPLGLFLHEPNTNCDQSLNNQCCH